MEWGVVPERLHGIDLLSDRIERANRLAPRMDLRVASAWALPYADESMDLVSAHTVFSSILDPTARQALAREMVRVLRLTGCILIYDFWISNPKNPDTTGIDKAEICRLYPDMIVKTCTLTLAPPLSRRIAPIFPLLVHILEALLPFLRTHSMSIVRRP
jgi:ubiquinone/menaquinone biosynthesis C-methylase UbiE